MEPTDLTTKILTEIRDGIADTNARLDQTNARLDQTNARLDQTNARLETMNRDLRAEIQETRQELSHHIIESEARTAAAILSLTEHVGQLNGLLTERQALRERVDRCEDEISRIKGHIGL